MFFVCFVFLFWPLSFAPSLWVLSTVGAVAHFPHWPFFDPSRCLRMWYKIASNYLTFILQTLNNLVVIY